jgi:hypothetical protein
MKRPAINMKNQKLIKISKDKHLIALPSTVMSTREKASTTAKL